MYKWFFAWRYLHTKLIAAFGIVSVMLCVAMVLIVISVLGGFVDTLRARARGMLSDIIIEGSLQGFPLYEELSQQLITSLPDKVQSATPTILQFGIMKFQASNYSKPVQVVGVRLDEYCTITDFCDSLYYNRYYPGTTTLARVQQPYAGASPESKLTLTLPQDHVDANAVWRSNCKDKKEVEQFDAYPFGVVQNAERAERFFRAYIDGRPAQYHGDAFHGLIIGTELINVRNERGGFDRFDPRGEQVNLALLPVTMAGTLTNEPPVKIPMRYIDDSRTGVYDIDKLSVYADFDMIQQKLAMDPQPLEQGGFTKPRASQLLVKLKPGVTLAEGEVLIKQQLHALIDRYYRDITPEEISILERVVVQSWATMQREIINALEKEKVLVTVLFGMISIVAIVLIGCIFYMIIEKKTRDIGILKALGASGGGIAAMFIAYAMFVGLTGSLLGVLLGTYFTWHINDVQALLISIHPNLRVWDPAVYTFDTIPSTVKASEAAIIAIAAIVSSMIGAIIPAAIAAYVWPAKALRYES